MARKPVSPYELPAIIFVYTVLVIAFTWTVVDATNRPASGAKTKPHSCYSPCDVIFPLNTEEDEFDFNYWVMARDHHPRLQVWRAVPNSK